MLDVDGFVSETNATNLFMVKNGVLLTPATGSCLPGITRWADGSFGVVFGVAVFLFSLLLLPLHHFFLLCLPVGLINGAIFQDSFKPRHDKLDFFRVLRKNYGGKIPDIGFSEESVVRHMLMSCPASLRILVPHFSGKKRKSNENLGNECMLLVYYARILGEMNYLLVYFSLS